MTTKHIFHFLQSYTQHALGFVWVELEGEQVVSASFGHDRWEQPIMAGGEKSAVQVQYVFLLEDLIS